MSDVPTGVVEVLKYVGPTAAFALVFSWLWMRNSRQEREAERDHRTEIERMRTTDIEQIVAGWDKSSDAMIKVCEETRQAVLQVHLSVKETTSAIEKSHQSHKHDHDLLRESIRELSNETRLRNAQHTPVNMPAYREE